MVLFLPLYPFFISFVTLYLFTDVELGAKTLEELNYGMFTNLFIFYKFEVLDLSVYRKFNNLNFYYIFLITIQLDFIRD